MSTVSESEGWALPAVSLVFLASYSVLVLAPTDVGPLHGILIALILACWLALIVRYLGRLLRAPAGSRSRFVRSHPQDLAAAVFPLLGAFTPLRRLHTLRGFRGHGGNALRSRVGVRAGLYAATFVYVMALTELAVERGHPDATIRTFGNAVWWACVTIATVGYGDLVPVTPLGRVVGIAVMAGGVAIIGTASALVVSYLSERIRAAVPPER